MSAIVPGEEDEEAILIPTQPTQPPVDDINLWSIEKFRSIPQTLLGVPTDAGSIVVLPSLDSEELHESGYRSVSLVFFGDQLKLLGRSYERTDSIWISPLAPPAFSPRTVAARGLGQTIQGTGYERIEMDCLATSGLLRIWSGSKTYLQPEGLLMSSAMLRFPGQKIGTPKPHPDDEIEFVKIRMREWMEHFGPERILVAFDEVLEQPKQPKKKRK